MTEGNSVVTEAIQTNDVRVRIAHKRTAKSGWELAETTVETSFSANDPSARALRRKEMRQAFIDGAEEADYRNENPDGQDMPDDLPENFG